MTERLLEELPSTPGRRVSSGAWTIPSNQRYDVTQLIYVSQLIWDEGNVMHIARHQVSPEEVEGVCHSEHVEHEAYGGRIMLMGPTSAGRLLSVVLDPQDDGVYYVVTARDASQRERRIYRASEENET